MRRWLPRCWAIFACLTALGVSSAVRAEALCSKGLHRKWEFRAGAPVAGPAALSSAGQVVVATSEGYVHALASDGAFLWSYTLAGAPVSGVDFLSARRLLVATSSRNIYALGADGQLHWTQKAAVRPEQGIVHRARELLFFTSGPYLYAARRGPVFRVELGSAVVSALFPDPTGAVWLLTQDARLHRVRTPFFHSSWPVVSEQPGAVRLVGAGALGALLIVRDELRLISSEGELRWTHGSVVNAAPVFASKDSAVAALNARGEVSWLDAAGRELAAASTRRYEPAAPAELSASGELAFVAEASGKLWVWSRSGQSAWCKISNAPLRVPVYDAEREQVIVVAGDGSVVAVGFDAGWQ